MTSQLTVKWFSKTTPPPPTKKENVCLYMHVLKETTANVT